MSVTRATTVPVGVLDSPRVWTRPAVSWMLYDVANTAFSLAILTAASPPQAPGFLVRWDRAGVW